VLKVASDSPLEPKTISIIIPTFNGASRIGSCLDAILKQPAGRNVEILVVNDGSTDNTAEVVERHADVRLITQSNAGPAAARNRGALEAHGTIIVFTDDDCVPVPDWLDAMVESFQDAEVVGTKGVYRTHQESLAARFVQIEYEDRYRLIVKLGRVVNANLDMRQVFRAAARGIRPLFRCDMQLCRVRFVQRQCRDLLFREEQLFAIRAVQHMHRHTGSQGAVHRFAVKGRAAQQGADALEDRQPLPRARADRLARPIRLRDDFHLQHATVGLGRELDGTHLERVAGRFVWHKHDFLD